MKRRIWLTVLTALTLLAPPCSAAIDAATVWEVRTTGSQTNGGGFKWLSLVNATYKWTASGSGTNEYYCEAAAGGDPSLTEAKCCSLNGAFTLATNGTMGSLNVSEWDWGDNDTLGYSTVYVRLADGADPDTKTPGYVQIGYGGGYDYSQQAAAQLSLNDIATDGAGTGLTSATGGFTALMVGNVIYLTGGTVTAGWYQITAYGSTNAVTIDRSAGASKAGGTGNVGGAFLIGGTLDDDFIEAKVAGNTIYVKSGEYTLGETVYSGVAASNVLPICVIGYDTDRATRPTGDNRPLLTCGAYYFGSSVAHWHLENLRATGTTTVVFTLAGSYGYFFNCKAQNTSATANRVAFNGGTSTSAVGCEGISDAGYAFASFDVLYACYAHDSARGASSCTRVTNSVFDTCTAYGIHTATIVVLSGVTIYNCATGIYVGSTTSQSEIVNIIIDLCTTGIDALGETDRIHVLHCCLNNTTNFAANVDECFQVGNQFGDPGLADPANGDFRITSADAYVYQLGLDVQVYTSAVVR